MRYALSLLLLLFGSACMAFDHVVIILDTSSSMNEYMRSAKKSRMEVAREALIDSLADTSENTKIGILTFNGWAYDLQTVDQTKLKAAINGAIPSGGTPLYDAIQKGASRLLAERKKQGNLGNYKLLVVTDGQAQDDSLNQAMTMSDGRIRPGVMEDVLHRFITVDVIGLDMSRDHLLKNEINGFYIAGGSKDAVKKAVSKAIAELGGASTDQTLVDEAFAEMAHLPESFARATVRGLTDFQNQPIGELAQIEVPVIEPTAQENVNAVAPSSTSPNQPALSAPASSFGILCVSAIVIGVVIFLVCILIAAANA